MCDATLLILHSCLLLASLHSIWNQWHLKKKTHPNANTRLFMNCNNWHQIYRKSNTKKSTKQMRRKSGRKEEGGRTSPSAWESLKDAEKTGNEEKRWNAGSQKPPKSWYARGPSFSCSSSAPCGGWTGEGGGLMMNLRLLEVVFGIASSKERSTSVVATLFGGTTETPALCFSV